MHTRGPRLRRGTIGRGTNLHHIEEPIIEILITRLDTKRLERQKQPENIVKGMNLYGQLNYHQSLPNLA